MFLSSFPDAICSFGTSGYGVSLVYLASALYTVAQQLKNPQKLKLTADEVRLLGLDPALVPHIKAETKGLCRHRDLTFSFLLSLTSSLLLFQRQPQHRRVLSLGQHGALSPHPWPHQPNENISVLIEAVLLLDPPPMLRFIPLRQVPDLLPGTLDLRIGHTHVSRLAQHPLLSLKLTDSCVGESRRCFVSQ